MELTDRQAADMRASEAVAKAHQTVLRHVHTNRSMPALGFRNGLIEAARELTERLIELYAALGASEPPLRDELVATITDRVKAFIQSSVAGQRGANAGSLALEAANLIAGYQASVGRDFDLAVYDRTNQQVALRAPQAPASREPAAGRLPGALESPGVPGAGARSSDEQATSSALNGGVLNDADLLDAYTGLKGKKSFALALFTFGPLLIRLKSQWLGLTVGVPTLVYILYHGASLYAWYQVNHQKQADVKAAGEAASQILRRTRLAHRVAKTLAPFVIGLLVLSFAAAATFQIIPRWAWKIPMPDIVLGILGIDPRPPPLSIEIPPLHPPGVDAPEPGTTATRDAGTPTAALRPSISYMRLFGCVQVPALIHLLAQGKTPLQALRSRARTEVRKLYFYDVEESAKYWIKRPDLSAIRFLEGPVWHQVDTLYRETQRSMRRSVIRPTDHLFKLAFPTQDDKEHFYFLDRWTAPPGVRDRLERKYGNRVTGGNGIDPVWDHLNGRLQRCGYLFLVLTNGTSVTFDGVSLEVDQFAHPAIGDPTMSAASLAAAMRTEVQIKLPALQPGDRKALLLAAYLKNDDGLEDVYFTDAILPRNLDITLPNADEIDVRAPHGRLAAREQIPMGWSGQ